MKNVFILMVWIIAFTSCNTQQKPPQQETEAITTTDYLDYSGRDDILSGGVKMIPITTTKGDFRVWTKRIGNNPDMKVLLLHGGPGGTHDFFEIFDSYFPNAQIEYYYYDQLESGRSDHPDDPDLWTIEHFVEEVEQVRQALGLDSSNFFLYGQSWGGILAMEYAFKYQHHLKGLIISNMVSSIPEYNKYANEVLAKQLPEDVLAEIRDMEAKGDFSNPRYEELLYEHYYTEHVLRMPLEEWPEPIIRGFENLNYDIYLAMQGPSEFGIVGDASLKDWDRSRDLGQIQVPTLVIGAEYDTMDPKHMEWMAGEFPAGRYLYCPKGSHCAMYDDSETYFTGLIDFIKSIK
ncbi:alpha/beta fold hydrolase [Robertkochia marina]|uniref:Alpha/beta fold hydrolase n=1 Tax=Robertkochia marina TaxID=1227945 RepID=A0A4S3M2A6_9FLAO|nr:proline iminopeptidase-family hydrolase [Robertkochia marina]THD68980.1 alpha/beta fold hydrolase [Robertkochia marina]TRZ44802.1 alpha/beta fold hydrolase [Robertkochia marina]